MKKIVVFLLNSGRQKSTHCNILRKPAQLIEVWRMKPELIVHFENTMSLDQKQLMCQNPPDEY